MSKASKGKEYCMISINGLQAKPYHITAEGLTELQQQLAELKERRMRVASELRDIASQTTDMGALEDSTLAIKQNQSAELEGQIVLLERVIGLASIIQRPADSSRVQIGSTVTVLLGGKERAYTIVGPVEADPTAGRVSHESPFGRSLLGKHVRDKVEVISPTFRRLRAAITGIA
jgi:transcription elongation factor GreA